MLRLALTKHKDGLVVIMRFFCIIQVRLQISSSGTVGQGWQAIYRSFSEIHIPTSTAKHFARKKEQTITPSRANSEQNSICKHFG
jgi:hypothetical protein